MRTVRRDPVEDTSTPFDAVPMELLVRFLNQIPISSLLSLCATSRAVRKLVFPLLDCVLWHQVHHGDFRWILPVSEVPGEVHRAYGVTILWYDADEVRHSSPFDSPQFPFFAFIRESLSASFSMMNRRRLWNICKQYESLGRESGVW